MRELKRLRDVDTLDDLRAAWPRIRSLLEGHPALAGEVARALGEPEPL